MSCPQGWAAKIHHNEMTKSEWITLRITPSEKIGIEKSAKEAGLDSVSAYILQVLRKQIRTE